MMKTAKLIEDAEGQAVRQPKEFQFAGKQVYIKRMGNALVLLPTEDPRQMLIDSLDQFSDDFMESRDQPE
jgi:antitoxin VapB